MKVLQNTTFEPYIPAELGNALNTYKPKEGIALADIFDDVYAIMEEFEKQRCKARGKYSFDVVYYGDLNKFLRLIQDRHPNAKQLCGGLMQITRYLDEHEDRHIVDFDSLAKH